MALLGLGVCLAGSALAQQAPSSRDGEVPPVERLVERALEASPSVSAKQARIEAAETGLRAADALPDPMVDFEYRAGGFPRYTLGRDPGSMLGTSVRQDLLSKGRRQARRAVAEAAIVERRADLDLWATRLATAVRTLYARLFALDRELEVLGDAAELLAMLEATAMARYAAGESDQASVLRVQLERSRLGERVTDLGNDRFAVQAALNRLMDDPPGAPIGHVRMLPDMVVPLSSDQAPSLDDAPEAVLQKVAIEVARRQVAEARQELRPAWSVGAGLFWQGGLNRMATFNVGIELPFWKSRKQLPRIAAAERELQAAELDLADVAAAIEAEALRLRAQWRTANDQIARYESALLPQNTAALDATRTSYLVGRGDFVSVLEEFRNWIEIRVGLARRQSDRYTARVELDGLLAPIRRQASTP